jgi:quercetin dioxygenase-like cupin family protein
MGMSNIQIQKINVKFSRPAPNNIDVYDVGEIAKLVPYAGFEHRIVEFQPKSFAANHEHAHQETTVAFGGELTLYYIEEDGQTKSLILNPSGDQKVLVTILSHVKHAIVNHSPHPATLMYWTDIAPVEAVKHMIFDPHSLT